MRQLLIQVILYNFQLIEQTPAADRSGVSDVIESFLSFCALIAKKMPNAFDDNGIDCGKLVSYGEYEHLHPLEWWKKSQFLIRYISIYRSKQP